MCLGITARGQRCALPGVYRDGMCRYHTDWLFCGYRISDERYCSKKWRPGEPPPRTCMRDHSFSPGFRESQSNGLIIIDLPEQFLDVEVKYTDIKIKDHLPVESVGTLEECVVCYTSGECSNVFNCECNKICMECATQIITQEKYPKCSWCRTPISENRYSRIVVPLEDTLPSSLLESLESVNADELTPQLINQLFNVYLQTLSFIQ